VKVYPVPAGLMQRITDYLVTRPYCEVADFLAALGRLRAETQAAPATGEAQRPDAARVDADGMTAAFPGA
jgi:hypothetical protein